MCVSALWLLLRGEYPWACLLRGGVVVCPLHSGLKTFLNIQHIVLASSRAEAAEMNLKTVWKTGLRQCWALRYVNTDARHAQAAVRVNICCEMT